MQGLVTLGPKKYESTHQITSKSEKKIGVQKIYESVQQVKTLIQIFGHVEIMVTDIYIESQKTSVSNIAKYPVFFVIHFGKGRNSISYNYVMKPHYR